MYSDLFTVVTERNKKRLHNKCGEQTLFAVFNFSDRPVEYSFDLRGAESITPIINSEEQRFGGCCEKELLPEIKDGKAFLTLPPFSGNLFKN